MAIINNFDEVAMRYAKALYDLGNEQKCQDTLVKECQDIHDLVVHTADIQNFIKNTLISKDKQQYIIGEICKKLSCHRYIINIIKLLALKRRLHYLPMVMQAYLHQVSVANGEKQAFVASAYKLSAKDQKSLETKLKSVLGKVTCNFNVDKTLIGGVVVRVGSVMFDASVKHHLYQLSLKMKGV